MPVTENGDVVPSFLQLFDTRLMDDGGVFSNVKLRFGEVQEVIYPNDKKNLSQRVIEYKVYVQERNNGTATGKIYDHCVLINALGSLADNLRYTLRTDSSATKDSKSKVGKGSKVLVLCINGETSNGVILGGLIDQNAEVQENIGHHLLFNFNGIKAFIDKDGQLTLTYGGKTNNDGKKNDDIADNDVGTTFKLEKDGSARLADKDEKNALIIDHKNSKVMIKRDSAFELGDATDKMLLGESFRNAQKQMNNQVKGYLDAAKNLMQQSAQALTTAGGKMTVPVTGSTAASGDITQAGATLLAASQLLGQAAQSIGDFEQSASQKNDFVSRKNKAD